MLYVDRKEVPRNSLEHTSPITFPEDEPFDIGQDTRTGIAETFNLGVEQLTAERARETPVH